MIIEIHRFFAIISKEIKPQGRNSPKTNPVDPVNPVWKIGDFGVLGSAGTITVGALRELFWVQKRCFRVFLENPDNVPIIRALAGERSAMFARSTGRVAEWQTLGI